MGCSLATYILALILLDKLQASNPSYILNYKNVHKLLMTAIIVSVKVNEDVYYKQSYYAKVAGLNLD